MPSKQSKGKKIQIPEALYNRLEKIAGETNRSISDVFTEYILDKSKA